MEKDKGKEKEKEEPAKPHMGRAGGEGKPGIIGSIVEFLQGANNSKPVSKDQLLVKLQKRFPERDATQMKTTINCQLGYHLAKLKGMKIEKNDRGYWTSSVYPTPSRNGKSKDEAKSEKKSKKKKKKKKVATESVAAE